MTIEVSDATSLLEAIGSERFGRGLDRLCRRIAPFEMSCVFAFHPTRRPLLVHDGYSASVPRQTLRAYLHGGYLLDPFFVASVAASATAPDGTAGTASGPALPAAPSALWRMQDLAPDQFFGSEFAGSTSVHPCISAQEGAVVEEIGYVVPLPAQWAVTYSLMRNRGGRRFSEAEFDQLDALTGMIAAAIRQHWNSISVPDASPGGSEVDSVLQQAFGETLTPSQFQVVTMVLRGHSSSSIAKALGISAGTVKVHRHNAYQRLGITGQADLFALFLEALEGSGTPL